MNAVVPFRVCGLMALACFSIAGCKKEPTRWDNAAQAPPATAPTAPTAPEQKEKAGSSFNDMFPPDGVEGYTRIFTQEKEGFAEAKLQKEGKDVATLALSDAGNDADAKQKFDSSTDAVEGHPLVTVGKNQSALLVKGRYQVKVSSTTIDAEARKRLLSQFNLKALAAL